MGVRNFPWFKRSNSAIAAYVRSTAGKNAWDIWFRAAVTKDQRRYDETGAGSFTSGEVGLRPAKGKRQKYGAFASLISIIAHGILENRTAENSAPASVGIDFPNSSDPNGDVHQDKNKKFPLPDTGREMNIMKEKKSL